MTTLWEKSKEEEEEVRLYSFRVHNDINTCLLISATREEAAYFIVAGRFFTARVSLDWQHLKLLSSNGSIILDIDYDYK